MIVYRYRRKTLIFFPYQSNSPSGGTKGCMGAFCPSWKLFPAFPNQKKKKEENQPFSANFGF